MAFSKWINPVTPESKKGVEFLRLPRLFNMHQASLLLVNLKNAKTTGSFIDPWRDLEEATDMAFSWHTCRFGPDWSELCLFFGLEGSDYEWVLERLDEYINALQTYVDIWEEYGEAAEYQDEDAA